MEHHFPSNRCFVVTWCIAFFRGDDFITFVTGPSKQQRRFILVTNWQKAKD